MTLKSGEDPGAALRAIGDQPQRWQLECGQATQAGILSAWNQADPEGFAEKTGGQFVLRSRYSSGLESLTLIQRAGPKDAFHETSHDEPSITLAADADELLANAPIGARVFWENLGARRDDPFRGENVIKIGDDLYIAHGFGEERTTFTRAEIEERLARKTYDPAAHGDFEQYRQKHVYVKEIETYKGLPGHTR